MSTFEYCRFCGSSFVHTREYGQPTRECVDYLRDGNRELERELEGTKARLAELEDAVRFYKAAFENSSEQQIIDSTRIALFDVFVKEGEGE